MTTWTAPVSDIIDLNDPLSGWEWGCKPIPRTMIDEAIAEERLDPRPWQTVNARLPKREWVKYHAERVAFLVRNPDNTSVELEVEPFTESGPGYPSVIEGFQLRITDGLHRVAAAHIRGDETITFKLAYGTEDELLRVLPSAINPEHVSDNPRLFKIG